MIGCIWSDGGEKELKLGILLSRRAVVLSLGPPSRVTFRLVLVELEGPRGSCQELSLVL